MQTKKQILAKIKELQGKDSDLIHVFKTSPRRGSKIKALEWVLGNVSDI